MNLIEKYYVKGRKKMSIFNSASEIMLAITEEVGEVANEVALLEKIGTKKSWKKEGSVGRLNEEIGQVKNLLMELEQYYQNISINS